VTAIEREHLHNLLTRWSDANHKLAAALELIADIAEGSGTANSLPHIARIARQALRDTE
jgi:hypothetical protein